MAQGSLLMPYVHVKTLWQRLEVSTLFLSVDAHPNCRGLPCQLQPTVAWRAHEAVCEHRRPVLPSSP